MDAGWLELAHNSIASTHPNTGSASNDVALGTCEGASSSDMGFMGAPAAASTETICDDLNEKTPTDTSFSPKESARFFCPRGHQLTYTDSIWKLNIDGGESDDPEAHELICDGVCGKPLADGVRYWCCEECDFDVCHACAMPQKHSFVQGVSKGIGTAGGEGVHLASAPTMKPRPLAPKRTLPKPSAENKPKKVFKGADGCERKSWKGLAKGAVEEAAAAKREISKLRALLEEKDALLVSAKEGRRRSLMEEKEARKKLKAAMEAATEQEERTELRLAEQVSTIDALQSSHAVALGAVRDEGDAWRAEAAATSSRLESLKAEKAETLAELEKQRGLRTGNTDALRGLNGDELRELERVAAAALPRLVEARLLAERKELQQRAQECILCAEAEREIAFFPCGHIVCCTGCAKRNMSMEVACCPTCRTTISRSERVYL